MAIVRGVVIRHVPHYITSLAMSILSVFFRDSLIFFLSYWLLAAINCFSFIYLFIYFSIFHSPTCRVLFGCWIKSCIDTPGSSDVLCYFIFLSLNVCLYFVLKFSVILPHFSDPSKVDEPFVPLNIRVMTDGILFLIFLFVLLLLLLSILSTTLLLVV